jgi:hypothetical protein
MSTFASVSCPTLKLFSSRSEDLMVAVGFSPRMTTALPGVVERRLNRTSSFKHRSATQIQRPRPPWAKAHGYRHLVASRPQANESRTL